MFLRLVQSRTEGADIYGPFYGVRPFRRLWLLIGAGRPPTASEFMVCSFGSRAGRIRPEFHHQLAPQLPQDVICSTKPTGLSCFPSPTSRVRACIYCWRRPSSYRYAAESCGSVA